MTKLHSTMVPALFAAACILGFAIGGNLAAQERLQRQMGLRQGPDQVFDRPAEQVLPALANAKPTRDNGRVGYELAFWGYELTDGREVSLFACALVPNVDCAARVQAICPAGAQVIEQHEMTGKVVHRRCQPVATGSSSSLQPGCNDDLNDAAGLLVGLVACH